VHVVSTSLNLISILFTILAVATAAIVVMAQARKISHEQLSQTAKDWQDIATARTERVNLLQQQQSSLQAQILDLTGRIAAVEKDRDYLVRRNLDLSQALENAQQRVGELEDLLRDNKISIPRREQRSPERHGEIDG